MFAISVSLLAAPHEPMKLWPGTAPGEKGDIGEEVDKTTDKDNLIAGRRLIRLGNVSEPTLTFYPAPADKNTGATVVVCPGGAYFILALDLEGTEVCEWLNSIGVNAVLLKYRVPGRQGRERYAAALQDAQRAMGIVRQNAGKWKIDPKRIGILGFSAGGHLAAVTSNQYEKRSYDKLDAVDEVDSRPDFAILVYPGYLTLRDQKDKLPPELNVTSKTPPTFIVHAQNDPVPVEGPLYYYLALHKEKVPAELHVFPEGGHGYGLRETEQNVTRWPKLAEAWMSEQGFLKE